VLTECYAYNDSVLMADGNWLVRTVADLSLRTQGTEENEVLNMQ
jgi:hypothetical protein